MSKIQHENDSLFNLYDVPLSLFGSWNSIKISSEEDEIVFCGHHSSYDILFPLKFSYKEKSISPIINAQPWLLTLKYQEHKVEVCFENTNTIRIRGTGLSLQLGKKDLMYQCGKNLFTINKPFTRRYQIEVIKGNPNLEQLVKTQPVYPKVFHVEPDENDTWEIAIDKYKSTWVQPPRPSFKNCVQATKYSFESFHEKLPQVRECDSTANKIATYINWATTVEACGLVKRPTLLMSKFRMDKVWSWDHAFNAMALASSHPELAKDQMLTMVDHQDEFGCYPDSFKDTSITYNFSKPPVHGWAYGELIQRFKQAPSIEFKSTMFDALCKQTEWWLEHRILEGETLPYYLHGNDSGWDNSTMFKNGVPLISPDLSALLVVQMDEISKLALDLGKQDQANIWLQRADELYNNLIEQLWDNDRFVAKLGIEGTLIHTKSLIPHLAIILGQRLDKQKTECLAKNIETHVTEWGLATEHIDSEFYNADGYWRGPIWGPSTFIAISGLDKCGYASLANEIAVKYCKMGNKSGFPENYNALTGEALKCPAYTWTASVFLLLAERLKLNEQG